MRFSRFQATMRCLRASLGTRSSARSSSLSSTRSWSRKHAAQRGERQPTHPAVLQGVSSAGAHRLKGSVWLDSRWRMMDALSSVTPDLGSVTGSSISAPVSWSTKSSGASAYRSSSCAQSPGDGERARSERLARQAAGRSAARPRRAPGRAASIGSARLRRRGGRGADAQAERLQLLHLLLRQQRERPQHLPRRAPHCAHSGPAETPRCSASVARAPGRPPGTSHRGSCGCPRRLRPRAGRTHRRARGAHRWPQSAPAPSSAASRSAPGP